MRYPYRCKECDNDFEVIKSVSRIDDPESCPTCGAEAQRYIGLSHLSGITDWVESYNPSFGCVVKSKAHEREILRKFADKGINMEPVGNEPVENIHKHFDTQREETRARRWAEADKEMAYGDEGV